MDSYFSKCQFAVKAAQKLKVGNATHHPKEGLVGEVFVLLYGGEDAEYEADEDHHEPESGEEKLR